MTDLKNVYAEENQRLRHLVSALGFDPDKVIEEFENIDVCKSLALQALRVGRDFSSSSFTEEGIAASNRWLNNLIRTPR